MDRSPNIPHNVIEAALRRMQRKNFAPGSNGYTARHARLAKEILHHKPALEELAAQFEHWIKELGGPQRHDELNRWLWMTCRTPFILAIEEVARIYNLAGTPSNAPRLAG